MEITDQGLHSKAKKYKEMFENYDISPNYFNHKDIKYYLVTYKGKIINGEKLAVISDDEASIDELDYAFEKLIYIHNFLNSIITKGTDRMKINMEAYKETKSFLEKELSEFELNEQERKHYQYALNSIKNILDFHNSHIDSMKNASSYLKDRASNNQEFDLSELRKLEDFVSELDYLQYRLLLTSLRMVESFKFIEKNERLSHADKDIKLFIKEFANSENTIKREVSKVEYIEGMDNLSKGEHKEKVIEYLYEKQDRDFKKLKKDVRNL